MKKILHPVILGLLIFSCSSSGGGEDPIIEPEKKNSAPSVPTLVYPTNNLLCIDNVLEFKWNKSNDSEGDAITYKIDVSKDNQFSQIDFTSNVSSINKTFTLEKGIAYYWRVKAIDSKNESSNYSSIFSLYTEGVGVSNHLPFAPQLVSPLNNTIETAGDVNLEWTASDANPDDSLTFDVYFGTSNPPIDLVSEDQTETTLNRTVISATNYYWKVIVKDNNGGETIGQIWNFSTN